MKEIYRRSCTLVAAACGRTVLGGLALAGWLGCLPLRADTPIAVGDVAYTVPNLPVTIPVLANDGAGDTNQLAILKITAPAHGTVTVNSNSVPLNGELARLFRFAAVQLSNTVAHVGNTNAYPRSTLTNGTWKTSAASDWISGFFPGSLWYLYEQTGDTNYRNWAASWTAGIASQQNVTSTPDLGFMFNDSFGLGYRLTTNANYKTVLLQAAHSMLVAGYNAPSGCLGQAGGSTFRVIIDFLMDSEILYRASALGGDRTLYTNAFKHAQTSMLTHPRADGSTYQVVNYNTSSGAVVSKGTSDGASDTSTWARGQGWGVYGFTMAFRETGDLRFLNTAQRLADYYLSNAPPDHVPYWDFQAPGIPNAPRDSSAAAITLSGLVELSQLATNLQDSARYWQAAGQIFDSLRSTNYLAQGSTSGGVLLHGTGEPPKYAWGEVDISLVYGDYYFIEALRRYTELYRRTTVTYVPATNFHGTDTFTYQVCDSGGGCSTGTVSVVVDSALTNALTIQISRAPGALWPTVSFPSVTARQYFVQTSSNVPALGHWGNLATNLAGSGALISVTDTNPGSRRFYRAGWK